MNRTKYSRTYHLPYSLSRTDDDKTMANDNQFQDKEVVVSIKGDGENTSIYGDGYTHARSLDTASHPSRDWLKAWVSQWAYQLDKELRVCGENMYALHSIHYQHLKSYFYGFGLYQGNYCFDIDTTLEIFKDLGILHTPIIYRGIYDKELILKAFQDYQSNVLAEGMGLPAKIEAGKVIYLADNPVAEGFVVRVTEGFDMSEFSKKVGKYVRKGHVQTDEHWSKFCIPNQLA